MPAHSFAGRNLKKTQTANRGLATSGTCRKVTHVINSNETSRAMITFDVSVHINSRPWADVFLEGVEKRALGQTPLSGVRIPIGSVLVFENPRFQPKRYRVTGNETGFKSLSIEGWSMLRTSKTIFMALIVLSIGLPGRSRPADELSDMLTRAEALYYEADFAKSIELLLRLDELLREPGQLQQKARV